MGNLYIAKKSAGDNVRIQTCLEQIKIAISNVNRILDFAKNFEMLGSQELIPTDVGKAFDEAISLFLT